MLRNVASHPTHIYALFPVDHLPNVFPVAAMLDLSTEPRLYAPPIRKKLQASDKRPDHPLMPLSTISSYHHAGFRRKESDRYPGPYIGLV